MRFLVDNALSPALATLLTRAGHDALHVRTIELQRAEDIVIFDKAAAEDRIVVSADTDFGTLLAARNAQKPSVIQFRGPGSRKPDALTHAILSNLSQVADALERGSIVTFEPSKTGCSNCSQNRTRGSASPPRLRRRRGAALTRVEARTSADPCRTSRRREAVRRLSEAWRQPRRLHRTPEHPRRRDG